MAENLAKWPSEREPISKIRPSDGCKGIRFPRRWYGGMISANLEVIWVMSVYHSTVVVCDLTGRNPNVFYELGIAHALGKDVIPITQNTNDIPFDIQHHRYILYLNNSEGRSELRGKLAPRIRLLCERRKNP